MNQHIPRFDDIVFEHRNKSYGAYALRRYYDTRIISGFVLSLVLFFGLPIYLHFSTVDTVSKFIDDGTRTLANPEVIYEFTKPPSEPQSKAAAPADVEKKTDLELPPQVGKDPEPLITQIDSSANSSGEAGNSGNASGSTSSGGQTAGSGTDSVGTEGADGSEIKDFAEVMPEYPGGETALFQFLKRKLRFPRGAAESNREATVYVSFVVYPDGSIGNVESMYPVGYGFDEEVIRVVQLMPKWKPGRASGRNVAVRYKLPVKFRLGR